MSVHADSKAHNLGRPGLAAAWLSALVFLSSIACTDAKLLSNSGTRSDASDSATLVDSLIVGVDEDGVPTEVKGYTENSSLKIDSKFTTESFLPEGAKDEKAFEFVPPPGYDSEFSQPVSISGSFLAGSFSFGDCEELDYHTGEPTFADILMFVNAKKLCSNVFFNFCVKLTSLANPGEAFYLKTPRMDLNLLCPEESFADISFAIAEDLFGDSVGLSGNTLAVGADEEDSNQTTITNGTSSSTDNSSSASGAVYIYTR